MTNNSDTFLYQRDELVRHTTLEGLYYIHSTKLRADGNKVEKYYQLMGCLSGEIIRDKGGVNSWWDESYIRKTYNESHMTFRQLMESLNHPVHREDFQ